MWYEMSGRDIGWMLKLVDESNELIKGEIFNYLNEFLSYKYQTLSTHSPKQHI